MEQRNTLFWTRTGKDALKELHADEGGLAGKEAASRLEEYGRNQLAEEKQESLLMVFLEQFKDLLVVILCIAAAVSFLSGERESTLVIFAVLILNAILGTVQYVKAEKSLASLKAMSAPSARVLRDGVRTEIPSSQVVPGDVLLLEAGDLVVADGRILQNYSLKVDEAALTGESEGVDKQSDPIPGEDIALGDRKNMVFSGSLVTYGRADVLVIGTGMETELGKIATLMNQTQQRKTPLQVSLDQFSQKLAMGILAICALVFALSVFRSGMPVLDAMLFAVSLAVAAIPEALGSIVTIVQAIGTQKMAQQKAIIKDLKAVESLGSVSVICSDKTGTLTQNRMTVQKFFADGQTLEHDALDLSNDVQRLLLKIGLLASDATTNSDDGTSIGDPTEVALIRVGDEIGADEVGFRQIHPRIQELAFDSDRKLMSTLHTFEGKPMLLTKGAIDVLLDRSNRVMTARGVAPMTPAAREKIEQANEAFSQQGLRVLAFGCRPLSEFPEALTFADENEFVFVGLVAMIDPPRPESVRAVADAHRAGIRTIMITGDHKVTATAIARQIGIFQDGDTALNGVELEKMSDEELDQILPHVSVYARVSPEHKIRIVNAWQRRGAIVSMTGDGVNDAPALKKADIGVAMGITGTEVSKDAASMILADDNFATIVKAVVNGRAVYSNIKNAIEFLLSGNMAGILAVLYAALAGLPAPFAAVHLLFINLLTDSLPAIAIGMEPARDGLLDQKPRDPKRSILDRPLLTRILLQGGLIAVATMTAFYLGWSVNAATATTMAFATLTLARLFHGFNCRSDASLFRMGFSGNPFSLAAFGAGVALLALVLLVPALEGLFLVAPLAHIQLAQIAGLAFAPTLVIQAIRLGQGK